MKIDLIFLIILCVVVAYVFMLYKVEQMVDTTTAPSTVNIDKIKDVIRQVYVADVEAIRNLSNVATKLQTTGLTIPGDINATGDINVVKNFKVGNTVITEDIIKRIINQQQYAGFAIDGAGTTTPLYEGSYDLSDTKLFHIWLNDTWNCIYVNKGWRITVWKHGKDDTEIGTKDNKDNKDNKDSLVPLRLDLIEQDQASSFKAEWIGY